MSRHVRQTRRHRHLHVYNEKANNMYTVSLTLNLTLTLKRFFRSSESCDVMYTMTQRFAVLRTKGPMSFSLQSAESLELRYNEMSKITLPE